MAKSDEIKVGDTVFAVQGFEDVEGKLHDITAVVESIKDGVYKLSSEEFNLSELDFEEADLVKKPKETSSSTSSGKKGKKVEVDAETLEKLVSGYEGLQQKVKDLEGAADLGRLQRIQAARNDGKLIKAAKVSVYEKKYVLGWVVERDDVYFDESGKMNEDQQIKLFLFNGKGKDPIETKPISYRQFSRLTTKVEGEVIKESKESDGKVSFTVLLPDGLKLELPIVFLN